MTHVKRELCESGRMSNRRVGAANDGRSPCRRILKGGMARPAGAQQSSTNKGLSSPNPISLPIDLSALFCVVPNRSDVEDEPGVGGEPRSDR